MTAAYFKTKNNNMIKIPIKTVSPTDSRPFSRFPPLEEPFEGE
jgi:hypothetical protein